MGKLQDWGWRSDWWRNQRGEFWVIGQTILSIGFVLLPIVPVDGISEKVGLLGAITSGSIALLLGLGGLWQLGDNLTPLPHPKDDSSLVTTGAYRFVRHPIYSSVIFLSLAFALWHMSISHAIASFGFLLFFDRKSAQEEVWLADRFPGYQDYRRSVKKLLPFVY